MKIGLFPFITDYSMPVDQLAIAAEERGFDSIWVPEHTHIPANRKTPYPGGGDLPKEYSHTLDPFVALAIAAGVTTTLKLVNRLVPLDDGGGDLRGLADEADRPRAVFRPGRADVGNVERIRAWFGFLLPARRQSPIRPRCSFEHPTQNQETPWPSHLASGARPAKEKRHETE